MKRPYIGDLSAFTESQVESARCRLQKTAQPQDNGCLVWPMRRNGAGYGCIGMGGRNMLAHRVAFILSKGPIPDGMPLDHLCRNRACINPDHLEIVTHTENVRRGVRCYRDTGVCARGHSLHDAYRSSGRLTCRQCALASYRRVRASIPDEERKKKARDKYASMTPEQKARRLVWITRYLNKRKKHDDGTRGADQAV
jgi:hypothetical protein